MVASGRGAHIRWEEQCRRARSLFFTSAGEKKGASTTALLLPANVCAAPTRDHCIDHRYIVKPDTTFLSQSRRLSPVRPAKLSWNETGFARTGRCRSFKTHRAG